MPPPVKLHDDYEWVADLLSDVANVLDKSGFVVVPKLLENCVDNLRYEVIQSEEHICMLQKLNVDVSASTKRLFAANR